MSSKGDITFLKNIFRQFHPPAILAEGSRLDSYLSRQLSSPQFDYKKIFSMLFPLILDQFFIYAINMLSSAMISSSSQDSVTAVGMMSPIVMIMMSLLFAVSSGGTVIVAQASGKGDADMVKKTASQIIIAGLLLTLAACTLIICFAEPVVDLFYSGADPLIRQKSCVYLRGICVSMIPFAIYNSIFAVLRGTGDTKLCLRLTIIINILFLVFNLLFVNLLKLDIHGSYLSLIVARLVGGGAALFILLSHQSPIRIKIKNLLFIDWGIQKSILRLGFPFALEQIFLNLGALQTQVYIVSLGTLATAANTISGSVSNVFYGAGFAVSTLAITVVGQCIGAGDIESAKKYGKKLITMGTVVVIISTCILFLCLPLILNLYAPLPDTRAVINQLVLIGLVPLPFFWTLSYVMPSTLRAAGDVNFTSIVGLVVMWIFRVGLGWFLAIPLKMGVYGAWISISAEWAVRALIFTIRFKGKTWYSHKVT